MSVSRTALALGAIAVSFVAAGRASAAVTFDYANATSNAYAEVSDGAIVTSDFETNSSDSVSLPSSPLEAVIGAGVLTADGSASAGEDVKATFTSAASAVVTFKGKTTAVVGPTGGYADAYDDNSYAFYQFDVDSPANFNLKSKVSTANNFTAGLFDNTGGDYIFFDHDDFSGSRSAALAPGSYTVLFYSGLPDYAYQGGEGSRNGGGSAAFSFAIASAVPEPSAWALSLVGLGGIGAVLRSVRRRDRRPLAAA